MNQTIYFFPAYVTQANISGLATHLLPKSFKLTNTR